MTFYLFNVMIVHHYVHRLPELFDLIQYGIGLVIPRPVQPQFFLMYFCGKLNMTHAVTQMGDLQEPHPVLKLGLAKAENSKGKWEEAGPLAMGKSSSTLATVLPRKAACRSSNRCNHGNSLVLCLRNPYSNWVGAVGIVAFCSLV